MLYPQPNHGAKHSYVPPGEHVKQRTTQPRFLVVPSHVFIKWLAYSCKVLSILLNHMHTTLYNLQACPMSHLWIKPSPRDEILQSTYVYAATPALHTHVAASCYHAGNSHNYVKDTWPRTSYTNTPLFVPDYVRASYCICDYHTCCNTGTLTTHHFCVDAVQREQHGGEQRPPPPFLFEECSAKPQEK